MTSTLSRRPDLAVAGADILLMVGICLAWALNAIACRYAIVDLGLPPLFFATARFLIAAVALSPLLRPLPRPLGPVLLVGLLMGAGHFGFLFSGFSIVESSSAAIILQIGIPLTALLSAIILRERVGRRRWLGIAGAMLGVVIVLWRPGGLSTHGSALIAASAASLALGSVLLKRLPRIAPLRVQAWTSAMSVLPLLLSSLLLEQPPTASLVAIGPTAGMVLISSALAVTVGSHSLYYGLLQRYPASAITPLTLLFPIFTVFLSMVLLSERPGLMFFIGTALTMLGVRMVTRQDSISAK